MILGRIIFSDSQIGWGLIQHVGWRRDVRMAYMRFHAARRANDEILIRKQTSRAVEANA